MSDAAPLIRPAGAEGDAAACAAIYAPYITDSVASFEAEPPDAAEMAGRIAAAHEWLVAQDGAEVVGFAYGGTHRERAAYRWAADVSVYISASHHGAGLGRALYTELFARLRERGLWTVCAGITTPNAASEALHRAMGFRLVGVYRRIGFKAGAWHDVGWWQLDLRPGDETMPAEPR